jgi:cell division protease FtsH
LKKEIVFQSDLERLIGKRPFDKETTYQSFMNGTGQNAPKEPLSAGEEPATAPADESEVNG